MVEEEMRLRLADGSLQIAEKKGWMVEEEMRLRLADGSLRKPDLVMAQGDTIVVCDVTIVWEGPNPLTMAYHQKVAYYSQQPVLDAIHDRFPGRSVVVLRTTLSF
ncbi:hypothetical protein QE152_g5279 [Popillia japonica]|uniref:Uncharacterized protein n=1 Tax=Popillia japonica TaxID=7064 RepID=A0AAW1MIZ1_POPJA